MKFIVEREHLLKSIQQISGPLMGRPNLPILGHLLLQVKNDRLFMTCTDLTIEIIAMVALSTTSESGAITVPARKFVDICRYMPEQAKITVNMEDNKIIIRSGRIRYSLSTLPASDFPTLNYYQKNSEFNLPLSILKKSIELTKFSMANQDARHYLNGMLFETEGEELRTVATDGHRLAVCIMSVDEILPSQSVILPRKGVIELVRMLDESIKSLKLQISCHYLRARISDYVFTSKLVDGHFPDYRRFLPQNPNKIIEVECDMLKRAFTRASIISHEKFRGVQLYLSNNKLTITANNMEHEKTEEILDVAYLGSDIAIGFNASYVIDVLNALKCKVVRLLLTDEASSMQIEDITSKNTKYIIMPMRL